MQIKKIDLAALVLVVVGALNWGLVAVARFDLVATVFGLDFGDTRAITRVIYGLVGLSGLWVAARIPAFMKSDRRDGSAWTESSDLRATTHA